jgi:hypothetical protein
MWPDVLIVSGNCLFLCKKSGIFRVIRLTF